MDEELSGLLESAAKRGTCLAAVDARRRKALSLRRDAGVLLSPRPGMFAETSLWQSLDAREKHLHIARAMATKRPETVFCATTAALAYGFSVSLNGAFGTDVTRIHVMGGPGSHASRRCGTEYHAHVEDETWRSSGLLVTSPARTVFDCARTLTFPDALAIADSALRSGLMESEGLARLVGEGRGLKGIAKAVAVLRRMDARAESGGESLLRARIIELGYKVPELQVQFENPVEPGKPFRIDMLSRRADGGRVALELDGRWKYENDAMLGGRDLIAVLLDERQREAAVTACGLEIMRVRYKDLLDDVRLTRLLDAYRIPKAHACGC